MPRDADRRPEAGFAQHPDEALRETTGPGALGIVGVIDPDEDPRGSLRMPERHHSPVSIPMRSARCRHCRLSTQATL